MSRCKCLEDPPLSVLLEVNYFAKINKILQKKLHLHDCVSLLIWTNLLK